jgi:hypothetical protein
MTESKRPEGFPLSEKELSIYRKQRLYQLLEGEWERTNTYSSWAISGLGLSSSPVAIVGIFPTITRDGIEPEVEELIGDNNPKTIEDYLRDIRQLVLPKRINALEEHQYRNLFSTSITGDDMLKNLESWLVSNLMPVAASEFRVPDGDSREIAILDSPTLIPPTTAFNYFIRNI